MWVIISGQRIAFMLHYSTTFQDVYDVYKANSTNLLVPLSLNDVHLEIKGTF